jgi:hypothetical protein
VKLCRRISNRGKCVSANIDKLRRRVAGWGLNLLSNSDEDGSAFTALVSEVATLDETALGGFTVIWHISNLLQTVALRAPMASQ